MPERTTLMSALRSIAYEIARRTFTSDSAGTLWLKAKKRDCAAGNSPTLIPGAAFRDAIEDAGGSSLISACPPLSMNSRVLSSTTYFHVTEFRYGFPGCQ